jgi:hypothetical protein
MHIYKIGGKVHVHRTLRHRQSNRDRREVRDDSGGGGKRESMEE